MKNKFVLKYWLICSFLVFSSFCKTSAQNILSGVLKDSKTGEALIGASVLIKGTQTGTVTDFEGFFSIRTDRPFPIVLECKYSGYAAKEIAFNESTKKLQIAMEEESILIDVVEISGQRISDKQKSSPLTVESLDLIAIKETPSANFYDGLGSLKDVDLTTASLGFTVINTRGFNSTSPVRSLQIIDGLDNQSPGLN
ncbi:MAG TPA: carboxypeptidase-like regulatory domain-containing protein, partial [Saprospiraceae bacterium]|nr:carboxypeptidase-like regulatory domain-containing protein [Saprospiraceae bacterium]